MGEPDGDARPVMRRVLSRLCGALCIFGATSAPALAHSPLLSCFEDTDDRIVCEAGYSDGASSAGQVIRVREATSRLILEAVFDANGTYSFRKPQVGFTVEFIGDASHQAVFDSEDLGK